MRPRHTRRLGAKRGGDGGNAGGGDERAQGQGEQEGAAVGHDGLELVSRPAI